MPEPSNPPNARAVIDERGIQAQQGILETERLATTALGQRAAALQQPVEGRLVQLPGPVFVGIGQRRTPGGVDAQVGEFALATGQAGAEFPEAVGMAELAEQHGHELGPAGEAAGVAFGPVVADQLLELGPRKKLEKLTEDGAESVHG